MSRVEASDAGDGPWQFSTAEETAYPLPLCRAIVEEVSRVAPVSWRPVRPPGRLDVESRELRLRRWASAGRQARGRVREVGPEFSAYIFLHAGAVAEFLAHVMAGRGPESGGAHGW